MKRRARGTSNRSPKLPHLNEVFEQLALNHILVLIQHNTSSRDIGKTNLQYWQQSRKYLSKFSAFQKTRRGWRSDCHARDQMLIISPWQFVDECSSLKAWRETPLSLAQKCTAKRLHLRCKVERAHTTFCHNIRSHLRCEFDTHQKQEKQGGRSCWA